MRVPSHENIKSMLAKNAPMQLWGHKFCADVGKDVTNVSTYKTQSCQGYAKRIAKRMLSATRKRHAHRMAETSANETVTSVQNEASEDVQNGKSVKARRR